MAAEGADSEDRSLSRCRMVNELCGMLAKQPSHGNLRDTNLPNNGLKSRCEAIVLAKHIDSVDIQIDQKGCGNCSGACLKRLLGGADGVSVSLPLRHFSKPASVLSAGQQITVSFSAGLLIGLSALVYLVPVLVMLLFTVVVAVLLPESEVLVLLALTAGLGSGMLSSTVLVRAVDACMVRSLVCDVSL